MKKFSKIVFSAFLAIFLFNGCKKEQYKSAAGVLPVQTVTAGSIPVGMVLTPQGLMPEGSVHVIENGYHLELHGNHILNVKTATGVVKEDFGLVKIARTTSAEAVVLSGSKSAAGTTVVEYGIDRALTSSPNGIAWKTYAEYPNASGASSPIGLLQSTWVVPAAPGTSGAQIYIGDGVENGQNSNNSPAPGYLVIEPALLWGYNGTPGTPTSGIGWTISNWCTWGTGAAYTQPLTVKTGTSVTGIVTLTNYVSGNYDYTSAFNGQANALIVLYNSTQGANNATIPAIPVENYAFESLQAYGLTSAGQYPGQSSVNMTNIQIETGVAGSAGNFSTPLTLGWNYFSTPQAVFGEHTIIGPNTAQTNPTPNNTGEVQLWFHYLAPSLTIGPGTGGAYQTCQGTSVTTSSPVNTGGGGVTYTFSPSTPPVGISYNYSNGTITAGPATPAGTYTFTVTATNNGGSSSVTVTIVVAGPPVFSYTTPDVYTLGNVITPLAPTNKGAAVTSYSVNPALPAGLSLNTSTGVISGTAKPVTTSTNYVVTANSACSRSTTVVNIAINPPPMATITFQISVRQSSSTEIGSLIVNGVDVADGIALPSSGYATVVVKIPANVSSVVELEGVTGLTLASGELYNPGSPITGIVNKSGYSYNITFGSSANYENLLNTETVQIHLNY